LRDWLHRYNAEGVDPVIHLAIELSASHLADGQQASRE
jgi:hypothetical protein